MSVDFNRIIAKASNYEAIMLNQALELIEEIINLQVEVDQSNLDDESKTKLKSLLEKLKEDVLNELFYPQ